MSNPKECRKFRADLRNRTNLNAAKSHIDHCDSCQKAINDAINNNENTQYPGENVQQTVKIIEPVPQRRDIWRW